MSMLNSVTNRGTGLPPRIVMHAGPKWGKTSFAAHAKGAIFAMVNRETGLESLLDAGLVPSVDYYPEAFNRWMNYIEFLEALLNDKHEYSWVVTDTGNGLERLCFEYVCEEFFGNDWIAFSAFAKGRDRSIVPWQHMLDLLDKIRLRRRMGMIFLHHSKTKEFNDPTGKSWSKWIPEGQEALTSLTMKWADVIIHGAVDVTLAKDHTSGDMKATGSSRLLFIGSSPAAEAGSRYGLPEKITSSGGAKGLWEAFEKSLNQAIKTTPSKPAENKVDKPKKSGHEQWIDYWKGRTFETGVDLEKKLDELHSKRSRICNTPDDNDDVREFVRHEIGMKDLEGFEDLNKDAIANAGIAVVKWLKLCTPK